MHSPSLRLKRSLLGVMMYLQRQTFVWEAAAKVQWIFYLPNTGFKINSIDDGSTASGRFNHPQAIMFSHAGGLCIVLQIGHRAINIACNVSMLLSCGH
jgi:hypothetical protein